MGHQDTIRDISRARLKAFQNRHYRLGSVVISASGAVSHDWLVRLVREKFSFADGETDPAQPAARVNGERVTLQPEDSSQTQFCVGFPGRPYSDKDKMAVLALASHLGGGMSSVLFQKIREQRGLAYSVYSYHDFFRDSGVFGVYLGTDKRHLSEAYDIILTECRRMKKGELSTVVLNKLKAQIKGHLILGMESTTNRMHRIGRLELMTGGYQTPEQAITEIDRVKPSDIVRAARRIFDESQMAIAALGPVEQGTFANVP